MKKRILPLIFFALFVGFSFGSPLGLTWNELGPNNGAGRTRAIIFDNTDATGATLYAGAVSGGIWKSTNLGLTWHQVNTTNNEVLKVSSMTQTASGTIYVGTGEMSCYRGVFLGTGLYRSDDGTTFTQVAGTQPIPGNTTSDWAYILKLSTSPSGRIFAATNTGLKYSDDGNTWATALTGTAIDVTVGPDGTVLAAVDNKAYLAVGGDVNNFVDISTGVAPMLPNTNVGWIQFAIAPSDANVLYASFASTDGGFLDVYASYDKGTSWSVVFPGNSQFNPLGTRGCYAQAIQVFPNDPYQVIFGGLDLWHGKKITSTGYYNWEAASIGGTFQNDFFFWLPFYHHQYLFNPKNPTQFAVATDDGTSIGTITASGFVFKHTIKGYNTAMFKSVAGGIVKNAAIGGAEFLGTMLLPGDISTMEPLWGAQINPGYAGDVAWSQIKPLQIFFGTGVVGVPLFRSEDLGVNISPTFLRDGTPAITNPAYTPIYLWESFNFTDSRDSVKYVARVKDIPADSTFIINSKNGAFPIHYTTPVAIAKGDSILIQDPIASRFFLAGTTGNKSGIFMTKQAETFTVDPEWFRIANVAATDTITCITVSKDLKALWAGTSQGTLYRLTDLAFANDSATAQIDSATCVIKSSMIDSIPGMLNRKITSISIANDNVTVLVTLNSYGKTNYVYLSVNGLDSIPTFVSVQGNLPTNPVHSSLFEMSDQNKALIGTDYGIYSTDNIKAGSVVWNADNTNIGNVTVMAIKQQTNPGVYYQRPLNYGCLYIATYGRGIFIDETYALPLGIDPANGNPVASKTLNVFPNPFEGQVTISYEISKTTNVNVVVYDLSGRQVSTFNLGSQSKGEYQKTLNLNALPTGTYLIQLNTSGGTSYGKAIKVK